MNKPQFRLARLLELKRRLCKHAERTLQKAAADRQSIRFQCHEVTRQIEAHTETRLPNHTTMARDWHTNYRYLLALQTQLDHLRQSLAAADANWQESFSRYSRLLQEMRTLENVEDKHRLQAQVRQSRSAQLEMDNFALRQWESPSHNQ